jgi:hypothetical protein
MSFQNSYTIERFVPDESQDWSRDARLFEGYLNSAFKRIYESIERYSGALKIVTDEKARMFLGYSIKEKMKQAMMLPGNNTDIWGEIRRNYTGTDNGSKTDYHSDGGLNSLSNLENSYLYVLKNEQLHRDLYAKLMSPTQDEAVKELFRYLLSMHVSEIRCLKAAFETLNRENTVEP